MRDHRGAPSIRATVALVVSYRASLQSIDRSYRRIF